MNWFHRLFSPDLGELEDTVADLEERLDKIDLDVSDIYDRVIPVLDRLSNRAAVRENRAKKETEKDISDRPGIIAYGNIRRN